MLRKFQVTKAPDARSGLCIDDARVAVANVQRVEGQKSVLRACAFRASAHDSDWRQRAESRIRDIDLRQAPLSAVMTNGTYHTLLVEVPNVPSQEVAAAVRWRVKDLIEYPLEDTVIEMLEMPQQASASNKPMAYAVATQRSSVQEQVDVALHSKFLLDVIDIPELCIRNVAASLPQDGDGVAFLHFTEDSGILTITRAGVLYLIRRIELGRSAFGAAEHDEAATGDIVTRVALEVQRSLDYYESHYDRKPIGTLVIGPGAGLENLAAALNAQLGLAVSSLDLGDLFDMPTPISVEEQGNCLLAVGAAMRDEQVAA